MAQNLPTLFMCFCFYGKPKTGDKGEVSRKRLTGNITTYNILITKFKWQENFCYFSKRKVY